jgi:hypothetical protein
MVASVRPLQIQTRPTFITGAGQSFPDHEFTPLSDGLSGILTSFRHEKITIQTVNKYLLSLHREMEKTRNWTVVEESEIFKGFVFDGQDHPPERVEQAARAMQRQLHSQELRRINDALLARLAEVKEAHTAIPKRMLLDDPAISTLVNTLALIRVVAQQGNATDTFSDLFAISYFTAMT